MNNPKIISHFLITAFISLLFILFDSFSLLGWLRASLETISRPQFRLNHYVSVRLSLAYQTVRFIHSGPARITDLERRLVESEQKNIDRQISQILGASSNIRNYHSVPVEVLAVSQNLIIAHRDFQKGSIVISPDGALVGVVSEIGKWSAKVRGIADSGSQFSITVMDNGQRISDGVLIGKFGGDVYIDKVLTQVKLKPGQTVVTSGVDDKTPPDILIGWIGSEIIQKESSIYQTAKIEPAVKINDLVTVLVINE